MSARLLRLDARCPRCGCYPALRTVEGEPARYRDDPPERLVGTYQCQRRGCGMVYDLTAEAYQRAS